MTSRDPEAMAGKSPLPPPGPFVTPMAQTRFSGIQPKFAALLKPQYQPKKEEGKEKGTDEEEKKDEGKEKEVEGEEAGGGTKGTEKDKEEEGGKEEQHKGGEKTSPLAKEEDTKEEKEEEGGNHTTDLISGKRFQGPRQLHLHYLPRRLRQELVAII